MHSFGNRVSPCDSGWKGGRTPGTGALFYDGSVILRRERYFTAGALKEADYVFDNVGFSSKSTLYSLPMSEDVLNRAEKTLAERQVAQPSKPSIKAQLAARPVPGDKPATISKDREVR